MIGNEIYRYVNGFLKWNISKKPSHIVGNKKCFGKICIHNFRDKRKSIFVRDSLGAKGERRSQRKRARL